MAGRQDGDGEALSSGEAPSSLDGAVDSRPESAGLSRVGADGLLPVFVVAAGDVHAARAAIMASASTNRLNMNFSSLRPADGDAGTRS